MAADKSAAMRPSPLEILRLLTERDHHILALVAEHHVLTTDHLTALAFPSRDRAEQRLRILSRRDVVARFRPCVRPGSAEWRYVLGYTGAAIVAARHGVSPPRPAAHAARMLRLAQNPRLGHLLGVNGFFASLARQARASQGSSLDAWWSEARATKACGELARPDGLGVWREEGRQAQFFLEYDTGTESLDRLVAKLSGYRDVIDAGGPACPVLFWLPSAIREANLRRQLGPAPPVQVATASADAARAADASPAGQVWLRAGDNRRRKLAELPAPAAGRADPQLLTGLVQRRKEAAA
jgi:Replication-relaxation